MKTPVFLVKRHAYLVEIQIVMHMIVTYYDVNEMLRTSSEIRCELNILSIMRTPPRHWLEGY